jgi:hypothetical protein
MDTSGAPGIRLYRKLFAADNEDDSAGTASGGVLARLATTVPDPCRAVSQPSATNCP